MSNTLYLSLYIKTHKTDLEFVSGPQKSYPRIRGLDEIVYEANFTWPRPTGKYFIFSALSKSPSIPPTNFQECEKVKLYEGQNFHLVWPLELSGISTGGR